MMPRGQAAWVIRRLKGYRMIKLNLSFFYQVGSQLGRLSTMPVGASKLQVFMQARTVESYVRTLIANEGIPLRVCRAQGQQLLSAMNSMHLKTQEYVAADPNAFPEEWNQPITWSDTEFNNVLNTSKTFETVLMAELDTLASYYVERKGIYDTDWLIQQAEQALPQSMRQYLDPGTVEDMRSSGRCLALDAPTASAFHILRATESILHRYYIIVCQPAKAARQGNWGAYLTALYKASGGQEKVTDPEVREVYHILTRIKDHRNNIMHPELVLTQDEAFTLFENAKSAIMVMLPRLAIVEVDAESEETSAKTEAL